MAPPVDPAALAARVIAELAPHLSSLTSPDSATWRGQVPLQVEALWLAITAAWQEREEAEALRTLIAMAPQDEQTLRALERDLEWAFTQDSRFAEETAGLIEVRSYRITGPVRTSRRAPERASGRGETGAELPSASAPLQWVRVPVLYGTNRQRMGNPKPGKFYGSRRGKLECGELVVTIPRTHDAGEVERPRWYRLEFREDPARHVVLLSVTPLAPAALTARLAGYAAVPDQAQGLIFIHGFNVTFEEAARRAAQIAHDLLFPGAPMLFSWPSMGGLIPYDADQECAEAAARDFADFVRQIVLPAGIQRLHVIAHSMGNRTLTSGLRLLAAEQPDVLFNQVILAAPDLDSEIFREQIVPAIRPAARRFTLYASCKDRALLASRLLHRYPRAGYAGEELVVMHGLETIDASEVNTDLLGHDVIHEIPLVDDLFQVVRNEAPPRARRLRERLKHELPYWELPRQ